MLPQIKRPQHDDGEVEIEVVDVRNIDGSNVSDDDPTMLASNASFKKEQAARDLNKGGAHPSVRASHSSSAPAPSHLKKGVFGDEPTQLMPVKKNAAALMPQPDRTPGSVRPPPDRASARPNSVRPSSGLPEARSPGRSSSRSPNSSERPHGGMEAAMPRIPMHAPPPSFNMRDREDSQTSLRPLSGLSEEAKKVLAESKVAAAAMAVPSAGAIKAQVDAARAKRLSDQRQRAAETLEVTPVSISERFIVQGRPAAPWAAGLAIMAIVACGVTVAFTGGHASAIAAFIDPAHEAPAVLAAPQAAAAAAPLANDPAANLLPGAQTNNAPAVAVTGAPVDIAPMTPTVFAVGRASQTQAAAQPQPAAQPQAAAAPVQVAAPTPHVTPKPKPQPQADPAPVAVAKPDPKPTPAPVVAAATPPADPTPAKSSSHHGKKGAAAPSGGGDVDSAAAADALAKAQLENSL
jgi:hypothetical protein